VPDWGHSAKGDLTPPAQPAHTHCTHARRELTAPAPPAPPPPPPSPLPAPSEEEEKERRRGGRRRKKEEEKEEEEEEGGRRKEEEAPRLPLPCPRRFPSHRLVHRRPGPFTTTALRRPLGMPYHRRRRSITSSCGSSSGGSRRSGCDIVIYMWLDIILCMSAIVPFIYMCMSAIVPLVFLQVLETSPCRGGAAEILY